MNYRFLLLAAAVGVLAGGCAPSYDSRLTSSSTQYLGTDGSIISRSTASTLDAQNSYWDGDGVPGSPSVVVNLSAQTASFYKGGKLVGVSAVSSGREGHETPTGNFHINQRDMNHASTEYGNYVDAAGVVVVKNVEAGKDPKPPGTVFVGAPMPYFMRIANGVGMHQGFLPGVPDSHGCIRMPEKMAKIFWDNAPIGTPVTVIK